MPANILYGYLFSLTPRERKALENSWVKVFAEEIFPAIDEKPFAILYSDKASRPNTPVNVTVGALIIKELFDYTDDEMVENLMFDPRMQYALHTTSFEEQPLSDKTLSRFRKRRYDYETLYNVDLYHDCIQNLSASIAKLMQISGKIRRMDATMIAANIRKLSRMELLYMYIAKVASCAEKKSIEKVAGTRKDTTQYEQRTISELRKASQRCGNGSVEFAKKFSFREITARQTARQVLFWFQGRDLEF